MPNEVNVFSTEEVKRRIVIGILLLLAVLGVRAQVYVNAKIDSTKILIGEQTRLSLSVTAKEGTAIAFPVYEPQQELTKGVEVVETKGDTIDAQNGQKTYERIYTLTAWDENKYTIPAQHIKIGGKDYSTDSLSLDVLPVEIDTLHAENIKPAKDVLDNPFSWAEWLPLAGLFVLAVLLLGLAHYLYKRLKDNKPIVKRARIEKKLLPHEKAMQEIAQIKAEQLARSEDQKTYYTKLTDTLRQYLEERFGINAMEMTSGEIIEQLKKEEDLQKINELHEVFATADLVKFAKYSAQNNENDLYMSHVVKFIEDTKQDNQPTVEPVGEQPSADEKRSMRSRRILQAVIAFVCILAVAILTYVGWQVYELLL